MLTKKEGILSAACWDLDHIINQKNWSLQCFSDNEVKKLIGYDYLNPLESGTVIIWEHFDRLQQEAAQLASINGNVDGFLKNMDKMDFFLKYPDVVSKIREVYGND